MSYLILVRHGQSVWNLEKKFTGWVDVDLTENGKLEAKKAGQLIKQKKIEINLYYSSFQLRAKNTLQIIQKELGDFKDVKNAWELNERHYGALTGLNKDEKQAMEKIMQPINGIEKKLNLIDTGIIRSNVNLKKSDISIIFL